MSLQPPPLDMSSERFKGWLRDLWSQVSTLTLSGSSGTLVQIDSNGNMTASSLSSDKVLEDTDISGTTNKVEVTVSPTGTVTISLPSSVILDNLELSGSSSLALSGDARRWDDIQVGVSNVKLPSSNMPTWRLYDHGISSGITFPSLGFAIGDYIYFDIQTSHSMELLSDLNIHIHYTLPSFESLTFTAFQLDVICAGINGEWSVPDNSPFTVEKLLLVDPSTYHRILDLAVISGCNSTVSSIYKCKLTRVAAAGTDYSGEVYVEYIDGHYKKDSIGSASEHSN